MLAHAVLGGGESEMGREVLSWHAEEFLVEILHQHGCCLVIHLPQGHDNGLDACYLKCSLQAPDAFGGYVAKGCLTGREDDKIGTMQIEHSYLQSREDAVVVIGACGC